MNPLLPVMDRIVYLAGGRAASGTTEEVVRSDVLSALYGHHVDVLRVHGRVIVVAGDRRASRRPRDARPATRTVAARRGRPAPCRRSSSPGSSPARPSSSQRSSAAIVAIVARAVGVFTVIRGQAFAGEALGDIGAAGGSSAFLVGVNPLWGFVGSPRRRGRRDGADRDPAPARA